MRTTSLLRAALAALTFCLATVAGGVPLEGCGDGDATTGKRITLDVRIAATPESRQFTNAAGWQITLTKAYAATGAFYFFDGATVFARRPSLVREAHAHPGHYVPGNVKGELLGSSSADLLAGTDLGRGAGVSGPVRSATFAFAVPAAGPFAAELGANAVVLEGTGEKGGERRAFRAELRADELENASGSLAIEGCPFAEADMQADGIVSVAVKLTQWFDQVELDAVPVSTDGKPVVLGEGLARNQLVRGAKAGIAYVFQYAPR